MNTDDLNKAPITENLDDISSSNDFTSLHLYMTSQNATVFWATVSGFTG